MSWVAIVAIAFGAWFVLGLTVGVVLGHALWVLGGRCDPERAEREARHHQRHRARTRGEHAR